MRQSSAPPQPSSALRVLLIGGTESDRALIAAATDRRAVITSIESAGSTVHAADAGSHDIAIFGAAADRRRLSSLVRAFKEAAPHRPVIVLERRGKAPKGATVPGDADECVAADDPVRLAGAIASCVALAGRSLAAELAERRRTEKAIRRSEERARFLVTLSDAARRLDKPDEIANVTMRMLREALRADRCVYGTAEPDAIHFRYTAIATAPGVPGVEGTFPVSAATQSRLREGQPLVVRDNLVDEQLPSAKVVQATINVRALIIVPLVKGGRLSAAAGVHMLEPRDWTEDEVHLVDLVAERLWEAMELARVSRALRESEKDFRGLFELSAVGSAETDPTTSRFLRVNQRFCELTGYSEAELAELTFTDITHPDDREKNLEAVNAVLRGEADGWQIEKRYIRRDGSIVWAAVSGRMMTDADGRPYRLIANAADMTDRKRAEQALIASRRQLQVVTDNAPVLIANCGRDYRYKFVNRGYADHYGLSPSDLVGRLVADVVGEEAFALLKPHADRALAGERSEFEVETDRRDGGKHWMRCAYAPERTDSDAVVGWIAAIIDITERKRAEEALREADRRKDEFLAVLGHELRNPLAPLRTGLELLKQCGLDQKSVEGLRAMMERQLGHLIHLVDDLLDLARVTRGDIQLRRTPLDLRDVVRASIELSMPLIEERRHHFDVTPGPEPLPVHGDFQRLTQVVGNLLSNAAKYTEPGGTIRLSAERADEEAIVRVTDTGYGIPSDQLENIFEMFSQVPEHRARTGGGGIGIGLALSRQLVLLHGGAIGARSAGLGHGSELIVRLPLAAHDAPREVTRHTDSEATARRVLVVDDNVDAAEALRMMLELEGHTVVAVHTAADAIAAVEAFAPDVVLLDIGLPEMDGYEVARRIRARSGALRPLLLALTGWAQEEDKQRAREAGFDAHLTKPVDSALLRRLITGAGPSAS